VRDRWGKVPYQFGSWNPELRYLAVPKCEFFCRWKHSSIAYVAPLSGYPSIGLSLRGYNQ
jgi:hypothetical protein